MIFCSVSCSLPLRPLARLVADAAHPLLVGLAAVAQAGAAIPHGAIPVSPSPAAMIAGMRDVGGA